MMVNNVISIDNQEQVDNQWLLDMKFSDVIHMMNSEQIEKLVDGVWITVRNFVDFSGISVYEFRKKPRPRYRWVYKHRNGDISITKDHYTDPESVKRDLPYVDEVLEKIEKTEIS